MNTAQSDLRSSLADTHPTENNSKFYLVMHVSEHHVHGLEMIYNCIRCFAVVKYFSGIFESFQVF